MHIHNCLFKDKIRNSEKEFIVLFNGKVLKLRHLNQTSCETTESSLKYAFKCNTWMHLDFWPLIERCFKMISLFSKLGTNCVAPSSDYEIYFPDVYFS